MLEMLSILKSKKNGKKRRNCTILQVTETLQRNSFGKYPTKGRGDEINVSSILELDIYAYNHFPTISQDLKINTESHKYQIKLTKP